MGNTAYPDPERERDWVWLVIIKIKKKKTSVNGSMDHTAKPDLEGGGGLVVYNQTIVVLDRQHGQ